jgi:hypothetical protein
LSPADVPGRVGGVHLVPGADRDGGWSRDTGEVQIVRDTIPVDIPQGVRISLEVITGDRTGFVAVVLLARTRRGWAVHSVSYFEA